MYKKGNYKYGKMKKSLHGKVDIEETLFLVERKARASARKVKTSLKSCWE